MAKDFEWSFSLRHGNALEDMYDSDDDDETFNQHNTTTQFADSSSSGFDLSSREDTATFKPNPWTMAKLNAETRKENVQSKNIAAGRVSPSTAHPIIGKTRLHDEKKSAASNAKPTTSSIKAAMKGFPEPIQTFITPVKAQQTNPKPLFTPAKARRPTPVASKASFTQNIHTTEQTTLPFKRLCKSETATAGRPTNSLNAVSPAQGPHLPPRHSDSPSAKCSVHQLPPTLLALTLENRNSTSHQDDLSSKGPCLSTHFEDGSPSRERQVPISLPPPPCFNPTASVSYARQDEFFRHESPSWHDGDREYSGNRFDDPQSHSDASSPALMQEPIGTSSDETIFMDHDHDYHFDSQHCCSVATPYKPPIPTVHSSSSPVFYPERQKAHSNTYQLSTPSRSFEPARAFYEPRGTVRALTHTDLGEDDELDRCSTQFPRPISSAVRPASHSAFSLTEDEAWSTLPPKKRTKTHSNMKTDRSFVSSGKFRLPIATSYAQKDASSAKSRAALYKPPPKIIGTASTRPAQSQNPPATGWKVTRVNRTMKNQSMVFDRS
ncbi:hypothetical protein FRB95_005466 [Tulasnella sp. JGI-2019a]|nr:hypothetical protein FRB95_005466 [Tulasnella sp. JGI-2019a]